MRKCSVRWTGSLCITGILVLTEDLAIEFVNRGDGSTHEVVDACVPAVRVTKLVSQGLGIVVDRPEPRAEVANPLLGTPPVLTRHKGARQPVRPISG
jgi:hypothetical protein